MHFVAEAAKHNSKPVQCYMCLKYNHVAKYCKTKQQTCARCGDSHQVDKCSGAADTWKCCNCKGSHLVTSNECPIYKEQEKRMLRAVQQCSTFSSQPTATPYNINSLVDFPMLSSNSQQGLNTSSNNLIDTLVNILSMKMEKIIEATTNRLIKSLHQRISKIEKTLAAVDSMMDVASTETSDDSMADSDNEIHVINVQHNVQQHATQKTATSATSNSTPQQHTITNDIKKPPNKKKATSKTVKRNRSPNSSLDATTTSNKDIVGKSGGGVLLAVTDHIKCSEILNETTGENEIVAIKIPTKSLFKSIIISSIYIPPKTRICCDIFHKLYKLNNNVMIVGDLNAALQHMGSRKTNAKGRQLQDLLEEGYLYCIEDDSSTYERNDYEEKIDWILPSQPLLSFISNVETLPIISSISGHKPLTLEISIGMKHKPTSPRTCFNFKAANWIKFRKILNDQLQLWNQSRTINTTVKIEEYNRFITNSLLEATQAAIPKLKQAASSYTISDATRS
ncbi:unnamed protein product [Rotaria magnacalcarata]|uniref:Endonuclease/exonuclease/phosphatase domain-containing protein n=1 Tax=Rotaria magnacalcarata TaxID=392030 RepID=A0A819T6S6_9BILA|nr:unnamed protein product [Rotaria magnacalcarata]CAF4070186.1 unnamed protein product [Rotaria magnacalcarata]